MRWDFDRELQTYVLLFALLSMVNHVMKTDSGVWTTTDWLELAPLAAETARGGMDR